MPESYNLLEEILQTASIPLTIYGIREMEQQIFRDQADIPSLYQLYPKNDALISGQSLEVQTFNYIDQSESATTAVAKNQYNATKEIIDTNETDLYFFSLSHDILESQIDLDKDFIDALNELAAIDGKDFPSR